MRRIHAEANYDFAGTDIEEDFDFEFDDDVTDEEIDEEIWNWACERVTTAWREE